MYQSKLNLWQTEIAIKKTKDFFEEKLAEVLDLTRVSAPLFVETDTGLNDNLSGVERPVHFSTSFDKTDLQIVQSLAKWKRMALYRYHCPEGQGIYTDMNAIRRDEVLDSLHSIYVDQWDWERRISSTQRNLDYLKETVRSIYRVMLATEAYLTALYPVLEKKLPREIHFVHTEELLQRYPELSPKEREHAICREYGAVFLIGIGHALSNGVAHDGRAPDYDDWNLNGDILVYYPMMDIAFEMSSMGIRVDSEALKYQLKLANAMDRLQKPYHRLLAEGILPLTIGGGIGQSRMCMFFLEKAHIGEVQASYWPSEVIESMKSYGVTLL